MALRVLARLAAIAAMCATVLTAAATELKSAAITLSPQVRSAIVDFEVVNWPFRGQVEVTLSPAQQAFTVQVTPVPTSAATPANYVVTAQGTGRVLLDLQIGEAEVRTFGRRWQVLVGTSQHALVAALVSGRVTISDGAPQAATGLREKVRDAPPQALTPTAPPPNLVLRAQPLPAPAPVAPPPASGSVGYVPPPPQGATGSTAPPPPQSGVVAAPPPAADGQGQAITVTCPPNASPYAVSTDAQSRGWLIRTSWAPFLDVRVINPASLNAGAVVVCVYGYKRGSLTGGPMPMFSLAQNLGAGTKAAACAVNGETVTCAGGKTLRCPPNRTQVGEDLIQGNRWLFLTASPSRFMHATVKDPASSNAGAVVDCYYGPIDITMTPTAAVFHLQRNVGPGIEAGMCAADVATRTAICKR